MHSNSINRQSQQELSKNCWQL